MNWILGFLVALTGATSPAPSAAPDELASLQALMGDETRVVDALRRFARQQEAFMEWDIELAREYARAGEAGLAKDKTEQAARRRRLVARAYEEVLAHYPNNARVHNYYGEFLYDAMGDFPRAIQSWKLAAALDSQLSAPRNNLGIYYFHTGNYAQGMRYLDEALRLEPKNPDYLYNLAQVYLVHFPQVQKLRNWSREKVYREAMKASRKATELAPDDFDLAQDYAVNFFAGEQAEIDVDWKRAAVAWERARELARSQDEVFYTWLNEARVWLREPDAEQAAACLRAALNIRPNSAVAQGLLNKLK